MGKFSALGQIRLDGEINPRIGVWCDYKYIIKMQKTAFRVAILQVEIAFWQKFGQLYL
jgi:hypothetical protein